MTEMIKIGHGRTDMKVPRSFITSDTRQGDTWGSQLNRGMRGEFWTQKVIRHVGISDHLHNDVLSKEITTEAGTAQSVWWLGYGVNDREIMVRFSTGEIFSFLQASRPAVLPTQSSIQWLPHST
jgi:hypothetical protein